MEERILIRADAGGTHGAGHVMRMIALGQACQERGLSVDLAHSPGLPPALLPRLEDEGMVVHLVGDGEAGSERDARETAELARRSGSSWAVVDGYAFREDYLRVLRETGVRVLCLDDFGHCRDWPCDLVLNQNLDAEQEEGRYAAAGVEALLGPRHALLRKEFRRLAKPPGRAGAVSRPGRVLVSFGGVDPEGGTLRVLRALEKYHRPDLRLIALVGPANPRADEVAAAAGLCAAEVEILRDVRDMPALYASVDAVISAGGSSCYEWLYFGLPGWVVSIADNQDRVVAALFAQGLAEGLPRLSRASDAELAVSLGEWLDRGAPRPPVVVDAYGAVRVAARLSGLPFFVRPASMEDASFLFELANESTVRSAGFHTEPIAWADHVAWMSRHLASAGSRLYVVEAASGGLAGQVRFHFNEGFWEVGVSVIPAQRGRGLAAQAVRLGLLATRRDAGACRWRARIRPENVASLRLFSSLGFVASGVEKGPVVLDRVDFASDSPCSNFPRSDTAM